MKPTGTKEPANLEWDALVRALHGDEALARETIERSPDLAGVLPLPHRKSQRMRFYPEVGRRFRKVYRPPEIAPSLDEARAWCKQLAETHYENFHVASWFLPKALAPALSRHLRLLPRLRRSR